MSIYGPDVWHPTAQGLSEYAKVTYVNTQDSLRVLKAGDTMTGDLRLNVGADAVRLLGCTNLTSSKGFTLALGNLQNQLHFAVIPAEQTQTPLTLETSDGFLVRAAGQDVCHHRNRETTQHQNLSMNGHRLMYLPEPASDQDAATKSYVDRHKCDIYTAEFTGAENHWSILQLSAARPTSVSLLNEAHLKISLYSGFWRFMVFGECNVQTKICIVQCSDTSDGPECELQTVTVNSGYWDFARTLHTDQQIRIKVKARKRQNIEALVLNLKMTLTIEML